MNKIKGFLLREGIPYGSKIWNTKGIDWLKKIEDEKLDDFIKLYELTHKKEKEVSQKIKELVGRKRDLELLKTIPGIGDFGAALIYAEIGSLDRFPSVKHLHAYAGVAPGIYQSGSKSRPANRKQVNLWLKWIIMECAGRTTNSKSQTFLRNYYYKIRNKKGWKIARKSVARKMLTIALHILKEKIPYHES
jgi:transposase